ncbi:IF44L protein, partial [Atractosteus spatula]|nr:IF44L protein [Atractosteus spatula]
EKERLMNEIRTLTPRYKEVKKIKIMLAGQIGAGKSSYINTVDFMFQGQFSGPALPGEGGASFTKKLTPYHFNAPFVIYDTMGIDINMKSSDDYVSAAKGYIEDGYVVSCNDNASPFHHITALGKSYVLIISSFRWKAW